MAGLPLDDLRVLDLTVARAGPTCVRQLADWGADVVRVEAPPAARHAGRRAGGRRARLARLPEPAPQQALAHARPEVGGGPGAVLPPGRHAPTSSSRTCGPPVKYRLGVDYETLSARRTRGSSTARSPASARTAPTPTRGGVDQIAQGLGGLMSVTGLPGQGPVRVGVPIADLAAGMYLARRHPGRAARARALG